MSIGGPRDRNDVLRIIERRISKNTDTLRECRERGETLDVEYMRGCISELEVMRSVVEALQAPLVASPIDVNAAPNSTPRFVRSRLKGGHYAAGIRSAAKGSRRRVG